MITIVSHYWLPLLLQNNTVFNLWISVKINGLTNLT